MILRLGMRSRNSGLVRAALLASLAAVLALSGCGKFFPPLSDSGGGSSTSGNYIYAGNIGTNPVSVAAFSLTSSGLSSVSGSPFAVSLEPTALAVTPGDAYLYMGSAAGGIYVYTIGSNGAITLGNSGAPVATGVEPTVLRVDPTGKWLLGADAYAGEAYVFEIGTGGTLTSISSSLVTLNDSNPATDLEITPSGAYVYVSCGTAGIYTLSFNTSTGALAQINSVLTPKQSADAIYGMAISPSGSFLFATETGISAVRVFSIAASTGVIAEASGSPVSTGLGPYDVLVDSTGSYVYVANRTAGTVSGFLLTNTGALTPISGSPFTTGSLPIALIEDKTDTYIAVLCSGGSPDLQVFTIGTTTPGALNSFATTATGTDPTTPNSIAATH